MEAETLTSLPQIGYRLIEPLPSPRWPMDGRRLDRLAVPRRILSQGDSRWRAACRRTCPARRPCKLCEARSLRPTPTDPWDLADKIAFGLKPWTPDPRIASCLQRFPQPADSDRRRLAGHSRRPVWEFLAPRRLTARLLSTSRRSGRPGDSERHFFCGGCPPLGRRTARICLLRSCYHWNGSFYPWPRLGGSSRWIRIIRCAARRTRFLIKWGAYEELAAELECWLA